MKNLLLPLLAAVALLRAPALAEDAVHGPKPTSAHACRVFLYVPGSPLVLDYQDVVKVHASGAATITFETADGFVVKHQGPFTLIGPKSDFVDHASPGGRTRFFEAK